MMWLCYLIGVLLFCTLFTYACLELHYFLRMLLTVLVASLKKKASVLDELTVTGVCLTSDIDLLLFHMNNARYLRELDFARCDFYKRTGLFLKIKTKGGSVVQGAATIRYRKFIRPFTIFQVKSKILCWDEQNFYMEHRFVTPKDGFVRAIAICRQRVVNCNVEDVMHELLTKHGLCLEDGYKKPTMPLEVKKWIECNEISSANLRNGM